MFMNYHNYFKIDANPTEFQLNMNSIVTLMRVAVILSIYTCSLAYPGEKSYKK